MVRNTTGKDSPQDVGTPTDLFYAINQHFEFTIDLAATKQNRKCPLWFGPGQEDTSIMNWSDFLSDGNDFSNLGKNHVCWMNPPHGNIGPFYERLAQIYDMRGPTVVSLVPFDKAGWYQEFARGRVGHWWIGRVKYVGYSHTTGKDQVLHIWDRRFTGCFKDWDWRTDTFY